MREIRFRAWDKLRKTIRYDIPIPSDYTRINGNLDLLNMFQSLRQRYEFMQYTGTKDKNGKDIFEGDILQGGHYPISKDDGYVLVIEYGHDRFWAVRTMKSTTDVRGISHGIADGLYEFEDSDLEVIGNIYENPNMIMD